MARFFLRRFSFTAYQQVFGNPKRESVSEGSSSAVLSASLAYASGYQF